MTTFLIKEKSTKELIQFYNDNVSEEKRIKKFRDRKTAEKRCFNLWVFLQRNEAPQSLDLPETTRAPTAERLAKIKLEESKVTKKVKKELVCDVIKAGILSGEKAKDIVASVRLKFEKSKCTTKDVAWWRFELRKAGHTIPASHYVRGKK